MKRWIAMLLILVMTLSLLPTGLSGWIAQAEESADAVVAAKESEIHVSGNWRYRLMTYDMACIEGYDGDPTSLKIPTALDGYAVGAIAQGAFSSLTRLTSVTIPTQVFSIGAGAFYHPEQLTVTGYDGSAALKWAKSNGAKTRSLTDMYLNDGVVDLSGVGSAAKKTGEGVLTVSMPLSYVLTQGTVFFFTATDKYGMDYWGGRVTGVSRGADGATVRYAAADSRTLIDKVVASSDMQGLKYDFTPSRDLAFYDDNSVEASKIDLHLLGDIWGRVYENNTIKLIPSDAIPNNKIDIFGVPVTLTSTLSLDFDVYYDPNLWDDDVFTARFDITMTTTVTAHKEAHWSKTKPLGTVTIYGIKGFRVYVPVDLVVRANGSIDVEIKVIDNLNWSYDNRKNRTIPKPVYTHQKPANTIVFQGDITVGLQISLALELCWDDVLKIGIEGGVTGYGKLTLPRNCIDLQVWLYADVFIDTLFTDEKHWNITKVPLLTKHIEVDSLVPFEYKSYNSPDLCTRQDKTIRFDLNGGEPMQVFKDTKVAWGSAFVITGPTKLKHRFLGWYTDKALTKKWTNGSLVYDDMTLYAAWERLYEPVASLTLNRSAMTLHSSGSDRTGKLTATVLPSDATNRAVKWSSSDKSVATVDPYGNVTGISKGTAVITATSADNPKKNASCTVTVQQYVTGINVTAANPTPLRLGTTQLSATVLPANANNQAYTWSSSNTAIATVSAGGLVTAKAVGTAVITATASDGSGVKGSVTITVKPIPVSGVTVNQSTATIYTSGASRTVQLSATVSPSNADNRTVSWSSSNEAVAGVDSTGKVAGMSAGTAVITVRSNSDPTKYAQCTVTVRQLVTRLTLSQTSATLAPNGTAQWSAAVTPADASDKSLRWVSSNPRVATVSSSGQITAVAGGDAVISVQAKDGSGVMAQGTVHVTGSAAAPVTPDPSVAISGITLSAEVLRVFTKGAYQTMQLTAFVTPENAANPSVTWSSSNTAVATVDATGKVTGVKGGTAVITATSAADSSIKASCQVTVEQLADSISLNLSSKTILKGDTVQLTGTVLPANASNHHIKWVSSDTGIAVVDYRGVVRGVGLGTTTIVAEAQDGSGVTASFTLTVNPVPVSSVSLNTTAFTAYTAGNQHTVQLSATVLPANAEDPSLSWTSSNPTVATVAANGLVTGLKQGTAVITATSNFDGTKKATATVTVKKWVTGITITIERKVMEPGESLQATANVTPADATDKSVTWTSDNPNVVSVSAAGLLTSHAVGNAVITVTAKDGSGVSASMNINVTENPVYEIRTGVTNVTLETSGDLRAYQMTWEVLPAKATDKSVTWTSSDNEVAYVDANGRIIGVSGGTATITVQSDSNPEVTAEVAVTVRQLVESLVVYTDQDTLTEGGTLQLTAEVGPASATNPAVQWSSSNPAVATVSASGKVSAVGVGAAVITAAAKDGSGLTSTVEITVEKWLTLSGSMANATYYIGGAVSEELGEIMLTDATVRRMQAAGLQPVWTLSGGQHTKLQLVERPLTYHLGDIEYEATTATVVLDELLSGGTDSWTLTCTAGNYSAEKTFTVTCDATAYAEQARLSWSDVTVSLNESVSIPAAPLVSGTGTLPAGMTLTLEGDDLEGATVSYSGGAATVSFGQSSIYTFDAVYRKGNLSYAVPLTVRVKGEDGLVRLPVRTVELSTENHIMVLGETFTLSAAGAYGNETVDCGFRWESSNPAVATVTQNGKVTAKGIGMAVIFAYAENSHAYGWCMVRVEKPLSFVQDEIEATVYVGGAGSAELANILLTAESAARLEAQGVKPVWTLEKVSGSAVELAVAEFEGTDVSTVVGSILSLVRVYGAGDTVYRLVCTAGAQQAELPVTIHALAPAKALPTAVSLSDNSYSAVVGQPVRVSFAHSVSPASSALPDGTVPQLQMSGAFGRAVAQSDIQDEYADLTFDRSGTYTGRVVFEGSNYSYEATFTVTVRRADGSVAKQVERITVSPDYRFMLLGNTTRLTAAVEPADADNQSVTWSSYDEAVATVSAEGVVTAVGVGSTIIRASAADADVFGDVTVYVEDGLSMERPTDTINVYLDGLTRTVLDTYYLSYASSSRSMGMAPGWSLKRVSGSNLTLRVTPTEEVAANGIVRLGATVSLYSVTRTGTAVYDLTCTVGGQSATTRLTVNALERSDDLPEHLQISQSEYQANVNELIVFAPEITALPATAGVPGDLRVSFELDDNAKAAVNEKDYFVSRARSTFSFSAPGTYYANCVYRSGNVRYTLPVTFRIADPSGHVPVFVTKLSSDPKNLYLENGATAQVNAVFSPMNATEQGVTFTSTDLAVATVTADGMVTAVGVGYAQIILTPADPHAAAATCNVTVDQGFSVNASTNSLELYLQGEQQRVLSQYQLKEGTIQRLAAEGLTPQWSVTRKSGNAATFATVVSDDLSRLTISTEALRQGGTDVYTISCTAGTHSWNRDFTLTVTDLGAAAPTAVSVVDNEVTLRVGEARTLDFTPVTAPAGAAIPAALQENTEFTGIGDFYDALNYDLSGDVFGPAGNQLTLAFNRPGTYLLFRSWSHLNLRYDAPCVIRVTGVGEGSDHPLFTLSAPECTVYAGGQSAVAVSAQLKDAYLYNDLKDAVSWTLERVSGTAVTASLTQDRKSAGLYIANVKHAGTDVWRLTATLGDYTESEEITVHAIVPRTELPDSIALAEDSFTAVAGEWIRISLDVLAQPQGTRLPDTGADFWTLALADDAEGLAEIRGTETELQVRFNEVGLYAGTMNYASGNAKYQIPVYFRIVDDQGETRDAELTLVGSAVVNTVWMDGLTGIGIANITLADQDTARPSGAAAALVKAEGAAWSVQITSGASRASLAMAETEPGQAMLTLTSAKAVGTVKYKVTCAVAGKSYTYTGQLQVVDQNTPKPTLNLSQNTYTLAVGETVVIDRRILNADTGAKMASADEWQNAAAIAAMGFEYQTGDDTWSATFFEAGDYHTTVTVTVGNLRYTLPLTFKVLTPGQTFIRTTLRMPRALTALEEEAMYGVAANIVDLRGSNVTQIGSRAFGGNPKLELAYIPASVTSMAADVFSGSGYVVIMCPKGSYAQTWAVQHGYAVLYIQ